MTDLQNMVVMLGKSEESFEKMKRGDCWIIRCTFRGITIYFNEDGSFRFLSKD